MKFRTHVEVHHGGAATHFFVVKHVFTRLHCFIHHRCYLQEFFNCITRCLVQFFRVQHYSCFTCEKLAYGSNEVNSIFFILDVVTDIHLGVVALGEPVEDIGYQLEVWITEVLHGDVSVVAEGSHDFTEVS